MFNVTAMRLLLNDAKKKALLQNSSNVNVTSLGTNNTFGNEHDSYRGASNHLFDSINATLQKDISLLLSLSDLDAHSLWLKTAHDRKKLIKEVNKNEIPSKIYLSESQMLYTLCTNYNDLIC